MLNACCVSLLSIRSSVFTQAKQKLFIWTKVFAKYYDNIMIQFNLNCFHDNIKISPQKSLNGKKHIAKVTETVICSFLTNTTSKR